MVGDVGFIRVCWALNPRYSVPSREVLKDRIQRMYGDIIVALQGKLSGIPVAATMDGVSMRRMDKKFLIVTLHFNLNEDRLKGRFGLCLGVKRLTESCDGTYLSHCVREMIAVLNIDPSDVRCLTTDGAFNMVAAARELNWKRYWCLAHILHLTVSDAIKSCLAFKLIVEKVKTVVTWAKQTGSVQSRLQKASGKRLIQSVLTRWNSELDMLVRFREVHTHLSLIIFFFFY